jgi:hypothetical protein
MAGYQIHSRTSEGKIYIGAMWKPKQNTKQWFPNGKNTGSSHESRLIRKAGWLWEQATYQISSAQALLSTLMQSMDLHLSQLHFSLNLATLQWQAVLKPEYSFVSQKDLSTQGTDLELSCFSTSVEMNRLSSSMCATVLLSFSYKKSEVPQVYLSFIRTSSSQITFSYILIIYGLATS